jgi:catechol 2,3-dioxygenase-like lactoylglutathione lyase family enzyme
MVAPLPLVDAPHPHPDQPKEIALSYSINHIHIKSRSPKETADWYAAAFGFRILTDEVRPFGDRFIRCQAQNDGILVIFSGPRSGETLGPGDADPHYGLEHFALDTPDIKGDVERLQKLGAELVEGPMSMPGGVQAAFLKTPGEVRVELIQRPPA